METAVSCSAIIIMAGRMWSSRKVPTNHVFMVVVSLMIAPLRVAPVRSRVIIFMGAGGETLKDLLGFHLMFCIQKGADYFCLLHGNSCQLFSHHHHGGKNVVLQEGSHKPCFHGCGFAHDRAAQGGACQ